MRCQMLLLLLLLLLADDLASGSVAPSVQEGAEPYAALAAGCLVGPSLEAVLAAGCLVGPSLEAVLVLRSAATARITLSWLTPDCDTVTE